MQTYRLKTYGVTSAGANAYLWCALLTLCLNIVSQTAAFPLQIVLVVFGVVKADVKLLPGLYITLLDSAYFTFTSAIGILKFRLGIPLSVLNVFLIVMFLNTVWGVMQNWFDKKSLRFLPFWVSMIIPALVIAGRGQLDGVASNWQTPLIYMMNPALYFWGIRVGRTWDEGKDYFIKSFCAIFAVQVGFEILELYSPGCQFQNHVVPFAFGFVLAFMNRSIIWKIVGWFSMSVSVYAVLFGNVRSNIEMYGLSEETAVVSTFTRFFVMLIGAFLVFTLGKTLRGHLIKVFPWAMLFLCSVVFGYAVIRAGTSNQNEVIRTMADSKHTGMLARFEMKLIGDRGAVWRAAVDDELFQSPLIFKRLRDKEIFDPILGRSVTKMAPHNQFLTLVCRMGWWLGLGMALFIWWMHLREFDVAASIDDDRITLITLLAPSAAIFVAVGLTGQHIFTQMWHASSMASLTFPGILYGAVKRRQNLGLVRL